MLKRTSRRGSSGNPKLQSALRHAVERLESRTLLSAVTWVGNGSGNFNVPGNWSTRMVPGTGDDVTIAAGPSVTVTISDAESVNSLTSNSTLTVDGGSLTTTAGVTLNAAAVTLNNDGLLMFHGTQTLGGTGNVTFGSSNGLIQVDDVFSGTLIPAMLTIAQGITVNGLFGSISTSDSDASIIDAGVISADNAGGVIDISASFGGAGSLLITGAAQATAGELDIHGAWSNTGTLALSGTGTLNLGGTFTLAGLGTFNRTGGTVNLSGTFDLQDGAFTFSSATGSWILLTGTVANGTVNSANGAALITQADGGTLDTVTLGAGSPLDLSNGTVDISNGLTLAGTLVTLGGSGSSTLAFEGTQQLGGTGTVTFASSSPQNIIVNDIDSSGATLDIAAGITIDGGNGTLLATASDGVVFNHGTIDADVSGQTIILVNGNASDGSFSDSGTLAAHNGGTLEVFGDYALNKGEVVEIGLTAGGPSLFNVTGAATLGGTLNILLDGGFTPPLNATYSVVTAATLSGAFATVNGPPVTGLTLAPTTSAAGVSLMVTQVPSAAPAQKKIGGLDPAFGTAGLAAHDVGLDSTEGLLVQPDGKSIIIGTDGSPGSETSGVTRYNADGSVDTSFAGGGIVHTAIGDDAQSAGGYLLSNGDILVAGTSTTFTNGAAAGSRFFVAEYTSAGALDPSFGGGAGFVLASFSKTSGVLSNDVAHAIAVSSSGEIFVAGSTDANAKGLDYAIAAFNGDGTPAAGFAAQGLMSFDFFGGDDSINSISLQADGSIVAAGSSANPTTGVNSVAMARFSSSGSLDLHFGVKGTVLTSVRGVDDAAASVTADAKGNFVVGGYSATGSASAGTLSSDFLVLRYNRAGKIDRSFGHAGVAITSFNQPSAITSVLVGADGSITASGKTAGSLSAVDPESLQLALARYTSKGLPDLSFNGSGQAAFDLSTAAPDAVVGLGSPQAQPAKIAAFDSTSTLMQEFDQLTQSVQGVIASNQGGELLVVGNSNGNTVAAAVITSGLDLTAMFIAQLPQSVVGGGKGTASVKIAETGNLLAGGLVSIQLFTNTTADADTTALPFQSFPAKLKLKQGQSKIYKLKFAFPSSLADGSYYIFANVDTGSTADLNTDNNASVDTTPVVIAKPFVDLSGGGLSAPVFVAGKPAFISFSVTNGGNVTANALSAVQFLASSDGLLSDALSLATSPLKLGLKAGATKVFKVKLTLLPSLAAGTYKLLALLDPANVLNDSNTANNLLVSANTFTSAGA